MTTTQRTLRDIVTENYASASVFEKYGLDFCCNGGVTLEQACSAKHLDTEKISAELSEVVPDETSQRHFQWDLPFLVDFIINNHHAYVKTQIPLIDLHMTKVVRAHGERHPEVLAVAELFAQHSEALLMHMAKEEHMLFPFIKAISAARRAGSQQPHAPFGSVAAPIAMMMAEHEDAGEGFEAIRELLDNYTPPADACTTMRLLYNELDAFERDLHKHVFLENSILFPKAIRMEEGSPVTEEALGAR